MLNIKNILCESFLSSTLLFSKHHFNLQFLASVKIQIFPNIDLLIIKIYNISGKNEALKCRFFLHF